MSEGIHLNNYSRYKNSINFLYKQMRANICELIATVLPNNCGNKDENALSQKIKEKFISNRAHINAFLLEYLKIYESKNLEPLISEFYSYEEELSKGDFELNEELFIEYSDKDIQDTEAVVLNQLSVDINKENIFSLFCTHLSITKKMNEYIIENIINPVLHDALEQSKQKDDDFKTSSKICALVQQYDMPKCCSLFIFSLFFCGYSFTQDQRSTLITNISIETIYENLKIEAINTVNTAQIELKINDDWKAIEEKTKLYLNKNTYTILYMFSTLNSDDYANLFPTVIEKIKLELIKNTKPKKTKKTLQNYLSDAYNYVLNNKYTVLSTMALLLSAFIIHNQRNKYNVLKQSASKISEENNKQDKTITRLSKGNAIYKKNEDTLVENQKVLMTALGNLYKENSILKENEKKFQEAKLIIKAWEDRNRTK